MFVCLGVFVPLENFSLIWRRRHYLWRTTNFDLYSAVITIEQWGFFSVPHLLWHGPTNIMVISEDLWHSHLLPIVWRILAEGFKDNTYSNYLHTIYYIWYAQGAWVSTCMIFEKCIHDVKKIVTKRYIVFRLFIIYKYMCRDIGSVSTKILHLEVDACKSITIRCGNFILNDTSTCNFLFLFKRKLRIIRLQDFSP